MVGSQGGAYIEYNGVKVFLAGAPEDFSKEIERVMATRVGPGIKSHLMSRHLSGGGGNSLGVRTGTTRRAAFYSVKRQPSGVTATVGVSLAKAPHARIQEHGGTVTGNLTIPTRAAQTASGVAKFSARDVIGSPERFGYVGTFTRDRVIFGSRGDGTTVPLFVLRSSVRIKPVGYLAATLSEKTPWAVKQVFQAVGAVIDG